MKNRHKVQKKAMGGSMKENVYNAVGSPEMKEAKDMSSGFKKGGVKKKAGGEVPKGKSHKRLDKKARRAAGGPVLSSASKKTEAEKDGAGQGHEADGPKGEDPDRGCYKSGGNVNFIKKAIKHPGALHRELGVPENEKIPAKKLEKASHSKNPTLRRRANLAKTLKSMRG